MTEPAEMTPEDFGMTAEVWYGGKPQRPLSLLLRSSANTSTNDGGFIEIEFDDVDAFCTLLQNAKRKALK